MRCLSDDRRVAFVSNVELDGSEDGLDELMVADGFGRLALKVSDPLLGAFYVYTNSVDTRDYEVG